MSSSEHTLPTRSKFIIYRDHISFLEKNGEHVLYTLTIKEFLELYSLVKQSRHEEDIKEYGSTDYGYTDKCLDCNKWDYIVQGYCRPCFILRGLKYEDDRLN